MYPAVKFAVLSVRERGPRIGARLAALLLATTALTAVSVEARAQSYTYINIDNPGASYDATQAMSVPQGSVAQGINNSGQITGYVFDFTGHATAYSLSGGSFTALPDPGSAGSGTYGLGINNAGQIVGSYNNSGSFGFLSNSPYASTTTLAAPGAATTYAQGINGAGNIAGIYSDGSGNVHGFVASPPYAPGNYTTIDNPLGINAGNSGTNYTVTSGINDSNQVAGAVQDVGGVYHGFTAAAPYSSFTPINDPSAGTGANQGTLAYALNNFGKVVGDFIDSVGNLNAFLYDGSTYATIDNPLGVNGTDAFGINDLGQIVGDYLDSNFIFHAFLADPNTVNYTAPSGAPGSGNAGQSFAATDAAAGNGASQTITGGSGGSLSGGGQAGAGGNGGSTLTPAYGVTNGTATGNGGMGGNGSLGTQGGNGGTGTGSATFTGSGDVTANANGNGGNGGNNTDNTAAGGNGGGGQSTASATTSGAGNTATANATATGGMGGTGSSNGAGGTAQATASANNTGGGAANATATATAFANIATALANGDGGSGTVSAQSTTYASSTGASLPSVQGSASAPIGPPAAALTATSVGGPVEQLIMPYTSPASVPGSANAYVAANLFPTNASLATTYAMYSSANATFNNNHAQVVGSAVLSAASGQSFATPQTFATTVQFNDMATTVNGRGIAATILGGQSFGPDTGTVEFYFTESYKGGGTVKVDDMTYSSLSAALAALDNRTFDLGALPGSVAGSFYITANLDLTTLAANGIELNMLYGYVPEPATWLLFGSGLLGMAIFQRRRREELLALVRRGFPGRGGGAT